MFIVVEGADGAGKTTLVKNLCKYIGETIGVPVVSTREPGGTPAAEVMRKILFDNRLHVQSEAYLMFAARVDHWTNLIHPALAAGKWVVSDRFIGSTFVYQVSEGGLPLPMFQAFVSNMYKLLSQEERREWLANIEFVLDVDYETAKERMKNRADRNRLDFQNEMEFNKRREAYRKNTGAFNLWAHHSILIDAMQQPDLVLAQCVKALEEIRTEPTSKSNVNLSRYKAS